MRESWSQISQRLIIDRVPIDDSDLFQIYSAREVFWIGVRTMMRSIKPKESKDTENNKLKERASLRDADRPSDGC